MEHIIEQEPLLIAEDGYDITDDGTNRWEIVRPAKWSERSKYYAIEKPEPEQE